MSVVRGYSLVKIHGNTNLGIDAIRQYVRCSQSQISPVNF